MPCYPAGGKTTKEYEMTPATAELQLNVNDSYVGKVGQYTWRKNGNIAKPGLRSPFAFSKEKTCPGAQWIKHEYGVHEV